MAKIFISHSQRDESIKNLFLRAFRGTGVEDVYQEYEDAPPTGVTAEIIESNIDQSSAQFVLLSETVQALPHTRDWILWECGRAKDKPIWVFEPFHSFGRIAITIPRFNHYVRFVNNDFWRRYIHSIAASYNDSRALATLGTTAAGGALGGLGGAVLGFLGGAIMFPPTVRPPGRTVQCPNCKREFEVHVGPGVDFRCPGCKVRVLRFREQPAMALYYPK